MACDELLTVNTAMTCFDIINQNLTTWIIMQSVIIHIIISPLFRLKHHFLVVFIADMGFFHVIWKHTLFQEQRKLDEKSIHEMQSKQSIVLLIFERSYHIWFPVAEHTKRTIKMSHGDYSFTGNVINPNRIDNWPMHY